MLAVYIISCMTINYIIYCICVYLDMRYQWRFAAGDKPQWPLLLILTFGFIHMIGPIIMIAFDVVTKLNNLCKFHKKFADLGERHYKEANDPDYQAEKYLLGKK